MKLRTNSLAVASLFGAILFVQKMALPAPYDKFFTVLIQAILLALGFLISGFTSPILIGFISGTLLTVVRPEFMAMTLFFSTLYGVFVSVSSTLLKVEPRRPVKQWQLVVASVFASASVGLLSALTTVLLGILPMDPMLMVAILVAGVLQGAAGGYLAALLWTRYLQGFFK